MDEDNTAPTYGGSEAPTGSDRPGVHPFRDRQRDAAIVFVHGFGRGSQNTWGDFPSIVASEPTLED